MLYAIRFLNNALILFSYSFLCRGYIQKIMKSSQTPNLLQNNITTLTPFFRVILIIRSIHGWTHHIAITKRSWSRRSHTGGGWFQWQGGTICSCVTTCSAILWTTKAQPQQWWSSRKRRWWTTRQEEKGIDSSMSEWVLLIVSDLSLPPVTSTRMYSPLLPFSPWTHRWNTPCVGNCMAGTNGWR